MSSLRASLRLLPLLALVAACSGRRSDPEPGQSAPQSAEGGGGSTSSNNNAGSPSTGGNGGNGGAPSSGGAPGTGGMGGSPPTGGGTSSGTTFNDVSDMYPYCGCLDDSREAGACSACFVPAASDPATCAPPGACGAGCQQILTFLRTSAACLDANETCLQQAYVLAPTEWDDAVDQVQCACNACPAPFGCNALECQ